MFKLINFVFVFFYYTHSKFDAGNTFQKKLGQGSKRLGMFKKHRMAEGWKPTLIDLWASGGIAVKWLYKGHYYLGLGALWKTIVSNTKQKLNNIEKLCWPLWAWTYLKWTDTKGHSVLLVCWECLDLEIITITFILHLKHTVQIFVIEMYSYVYHCGSVTKCRPPGLLHDLL